jgi:hypothetical protein
MSKIRVNQLSSKIKKVKTSFVNGKINLQLFQSVDGGKTFFYAGVGRYCTNLLEAKIVMSNLLIN